MNKVIHIGKRNLISGFLFVSSFTMSYSQDTVKTYIAYDVLKAFINEHSVTVGHGLGPHHMVTFSLGYVYDNENLRESFVGLSPNQDEYPVMVYTGPAVRAGYEYRFKPFFYVGADIYFKHLHYDDHEFKDEDGKDNMVIYKRSEKSNFYGGHVNVGFLVTIPKTPVLINPSVSIGGTMKFRNYTTEIIEVTSMYGDHYPKEGPVSERQDVVSVMMSLNIGIRIGK
jgi:hypothetical protein